MLPIGAPAPDFTTHDDQGNEVQLSSFLGRKNVVLVFYPGNETPTCTAQLCDVRDNWAAFEAADAVVFGVNPGKAASHASFRANHRYPFPLLVDMDSAIARAYGRKGWLWTSRGVYVIDKGGRIALAESGRPSPATLLNALKASNSAAAGG